MDKIRGNQKLWCCADAERGIGECSRMMKIGGWLKTW